MTDIPTHDPADLAALLHRTRESRITETHAAAIARLEREAAAFRAQAEAHFAEMHERNMRLSGTIAALRNARDALALSLKVATREIDRLRGKAD
jgi:hypothetical protein